MRRTLHRPATATTAFAILASLALVAGSGCQARVKNLNPRTAPVKFRPTTSYPLTVGVTGPNIRGAGSSGGSEEGFADFLANEQVFKRVVYPYRHGRDEVDLVARVTADGDFRSGGAANFFTWFPGGLLLLPNFRGTRWTYDARAEVEVLDARTDAPVGKYVAETSHMSIHQSSSPGPLLSAALIIPAVIKGARVSSPKRPYTTMIYSAAYPDLWKQIAAQIVSREDEYLAIAERAGSARHAARQPPPQPQRTYRPSTPNRPSRASAAPAIDYGELYSRRVAVVIGINDYASWPSLQGARGDANRVGDYLRGTGFDHVIEIYDRDATRQRLLSVLGNELAQHVDKDSMVFVYFAGHGDTETLPGGSKRGYLIPADADDDVFATGISMDTVRDLSNRMTAKHVLYAIDACYSGLALTRGISVPKSTSGYLRKVTRMRAVQILAAGSEGEQAVEIGGQGLFTTYLLKGISGEADLDGDGAVTAREIGTYVRPQVTVASGARQTPQFGTIEGSGEVVFFDH